MNVTKKLLVMMLLFSVLLMAYFVVAATKDYVSVDVINTSVGTKSQGGGFYVDSSNGLLTNGTQLVLSQTDPGTNLTGIVNINVSLIANGTHGNYVNITFGFQLTNTTSYGGPGKGNGSYMLNVTIFNNTLNQTRFNYSFNTNILPEGFYNISIWVENATAETGTGWGQVVNYSRGVFIGIDRSPPNIGTYFTNNSINNASGNGVSNFTGGVVEINASINDSVTSVRTVTFGITNTANGTQFNVSTSKNLSFYNAQLVLSTMTDGLYNIQVYANDTLNNQNNSVVNTSFTIDRSSPGIRTYFTNNSINNGSVNGVSNFTGGVVEINASINDSVTSVGTVVFGIFNTANATEFNISVSKNLSFYHAQLVLSTMTDGLYNIRIHADDILSNRNSTVVNTSFTIDRSAPFVLNVLTNTTNSNVSNNNNNVTGSIQINVTTNDTTTSVSAVVFGLTSISNSTQFNATASKVGAFWTLSLATNTMNDGNYNVQIFTDDVLSNRNSSVINTSFKVDQSSPSIGTYFTNNSINNASVNGGTNLTGGVVEINASINDSVTSVGTVRFGIFNTANATEFNISVSKNLSFYHAQLVLSTMTDGLYNIRIHADDILSNRNSTVVNTSFTIDRTPPNVTGLTWDNYTFGSNLSAAFSDNFLSLNATINDTTTKVTSVFIGINSTNGTQFNVTTTAVSGGRWNVTINLTLLTEGAHSFRVYANDTLLNQNNTEISTFTIDRTKPTVSVACSPSDATAGQTVTCTCTRTDATTGIVVASSGFSGSSTTESTTATGSGSFTSSTCSARDYAGNINSATGSWTVTAASSGGGGGGGSGGGSASGVAGVFEKKTWASINAGETATVPVANGAIGVTEVSFAVSKTTYGAWVQIKKVDSLPSSVEAFDRKVYRTVDMTQNNVDKVLQGAATIKFKVEKGWLTDNKVKKEDVSLFHYVGGSWTELATASAEDDGTYVHYSAQTPGFSYFVIGQKKEVAAAAVGTTPGKETPAAEEAAMTEKVPEEAAAMPQPVPEKGKVPVWIVPLVIAVVLLAVLYYYWKKK